MCLDISFKIDETEDSLFDYLPHLKIDPQLDMDFDNNSHVQAHDRPRTQIIYSKDDGDPVLTLMRWGVLMNYMFKDELSFKKYANNNYNARAENIFDKKSTWYRIKANRCLIDTPGIYEHRAIKGWKNKVPYFIRLASKKRLLLPAFYYFPEFSQQDIQRIMDTKDREMIKALNKVINLETGEITGTYTMITRHANEKMKWIHNDGTNKHRMPLFMQPEQAVKWIDPNLTETEMKEMLDYEIPSDELKECTTWTIRTSKPRPDGKLKHEPFDWNAPPLGTDDPALNTLF